MLAQIQEIDGQLSHAIEAYNLANVKLDRIKAELKTNSQHLTIARSSLKRAQVHLSERLVSLYVGGSDAARSRSSSAPSRSTTCSTGSTRSIASPRRTHGCSARSRLPGAGDERKGRSSARRRPRCRSSPTEPRSAARSRASSPSGSGCSRRSRIRSRAWKRPSGCARSGSQHRRRHASRAAQQAPAEAAPEAPRGGGRGRSGDCGPHPTRATAVSSGSRCSTSASRTSGAARARRGFDCSGFIMYVYAQVGVSLPHHAASQYGMGSPVSRDELAGRRPRLLQRARPRGHLHRRRPVHPRAPHAATWSRSRASPTPGTRSTWVARGSSARARGGARARPRGPCRGRSASG